MSTPENTTTRAATLPAGSTTGGTRSQSDAEGLSTVSEVTVPENGSDGSESRSESKLHREAANYRSQLRAAEARIERMQRAEIERLASSALSHPADLFSLSGNDLADYLTDDGEVDPDKVAADLAAIVAERPGLKKLSPAYDPTQGHGSGPQPAAAAPSWGALITKQFFDR